MHNRADGFVAAISAVSATGGGLFEESPSPSQALEKFLTQECSVFTRSSEQCISILSGQWFGENPPAVLEACVTPSTYRLKRIRATAVGQRGALWRGCVSSAGDGCRVQPCSRLSTRLLVPRLGQQRQFIEFRTSFAARAIAGTTQSQRVSSARSSGSPCDRAHSQRRATPCARR